MRINFSTIVLLSLTSIALLFAQAPQLINYQGILKDAAGKPTEGPVDITFAMYSAASGGTALWTELHKEVPLTNGIFNVLLGSEENFPKGLFIEGGERWLGITVGKDAEMTPRFRFTSVAYALNAAYAETASGGGNTLDQAYDQGGAGVGRSINTDAGAVNITGSGGITVAGNLVVDNEVRHNNTSDANLIPIAYGTINYDGAINTGSTDNFSVTKSATGTYKIDITDHSYHYTRYVTVCSVYGSSLYFITYYNLGTSLYIKTWNASMNLVDRYFNFIVYKK